MTFSTMLTFARLRHVKTSTPRAEPFVMRLRYRNDDDDRKKKDHTEDIKRNRLTLAANERVAIGVGWAIGTFLASEAWPTLTLTRQLERETKKKRSKKAFKHT